MAAQYVPELDRFLNLVGDLEKQVNQLLEKSNLTEQEKQFIRDHMLIIPGKYDEIN